MERFAKRKIKILPARGGGKHVFFCEDNGNNHHIAQVSDVTSEEAIYEKARYWYNKKKWQVVMKMLIHEKDIKTLTDTVIPMLCEDYKCRFIAEFYQLKIRIDKLSELINKYYEGTLDFEPTCPIDVLEHQLSVMSEYYFILKERAKKEDIQL